MFRRAASLSLAAISSLSILAASGCASLKNALTDAPSEATVEVPKTTPEQAYDAGVIFLERGDYDAARREWDRCVAMSSPDSSSRVDCMVALEKMSAPGPIEQ
ncbi:MAG TPA: hypothetical protein VN915_05890 [Elusimicrobiota bacterium]|nr:hypothetical protein [Elusimicrobiota bacterium]